MRTGTTKPSGATSFKQTALGVLSRTQLLQLEIEGTKRGLEYIYSFIKTDQNSEITPELICHLHAVSFKWIFPEWAGSYRIIQVTYSGKEAPFYAQVFELVINLCADLKERIKNLPQNTQPDFILEVVKLLAWFQHRFVVIHPFQDYNGRIARMLTVLILLKLNLPVAEIKAQEKDRVDYLHAMQKADQGDFSNLETLIGETIIESLGKV